MEVPIFARKFWFCYYFKTSMFVESDQPMTSTPLQNSFVGERKSSGGGNIAPAKKPRAVKSHAATLDKRPKRLIVSGFNDDQRDPVIDHLQQFGDLEDLEFEHKNGETRAIVVYKTRVDAEQVLVLSFLWHLAI